MYLPTGVFDSIFAALELEGMDLRAWAVAWARLAPSVLLVPAFGLRAVAGPTRLALSAALAAATAPALAPAAIADRPWIVLLAVEFAKGLPVALVAAVALWTATMAGGLVDNLRAERLAVHLPTAEPGSTPLGALLSMLIAISFLESGGASRIALRLTQSSLEFESPLRSAALQLVLGIELAVAIAAPLVAVAIIIELASALIARAAAPAFLQPLLAPLRSIVLLGALAIFLDRMIELLVISQATRP
jgi:type III secretory pathway component EscT